MPKLSSEGESDRMNTGSNNSIPLRTLDHDFPKSLRFAEDETTVTDVSTSASGSNENQRLPPAHKAVVLLKIVVIFILILSALMLSFLTYYFITQDESSDFTNQFADFAAKVTEEFLDITHLKVYTCYSLSIAYTTEFEDTDAWPAVTLNRFPVKTFGATDLARASCIGFAPYVTDQTRHGWESYAASIDPVLDLNSSAMAAISPRSDIPVSVELDETETNMKIADGIFKIENDTAVSDEGPGPYFPLWQVSPVTEYAKAIMYNQLSDSSRSKALQIMMATAQPIYSEVFYQDIYDSEKDDGEFETRGVLYFPVFDTFVSGSVAGAVSAEFNWEDSFRYILPAHAQGIVCVLENTCGQTFTYVIEGEDVVFMGTGDLHDPTYDEMEVSTTYDEFLHTYNAAALFNDYSSQEYGTTPDTESDATDSERVLDSSDGCLYLVRVYPSAEFEGLYHTTDAVFYAGLVALVFVFTSVIFISYDCLVQRRQNQVMTTAARANAIVESLFPAMVRERVFQTNEPGSRAGGRKSPTPDWGSPGGGGAVKGDTPKKRLRSFLQVTRRSSRKVKEKVDPMLDPIADHFPESTIMFADIAGFTAWSSEREPGEVFQLLETLYYAFDSLARQMGVFKLETIGDCYVAATGLPEPNKDHAIIMTRFAFEALHQMQETTRKLEISLGPGTSDLAIRIGLHSGPVTGGVLRGEKSRFQLFGDTMNTAARMESTGQPGMVQVSKATADRLEQGGKGHWLTPRKDVVVAKGKGEMQTYWIKPRDMEGEGEADQMAMIEEGSVASESSEGRTASSSGGQSFRVMFRRPRAARASSRWGSMSLLEDSVGVKNARLVDWNVDQLHLLLQRVVAKRRGQPNADVKLSPNVRTQLHDYVTKVESLYHDIPFHNFEHASHVSMSVNKLMKRIVDQEGPAAEVRRTTFGLSEDPLAHFAVVFSALIADVDHRGVPNEQLVKERDGLAIRYKNKSVAEQNSIKLAWETLKEDGYEDLREAIYEEEAERYRFRQLVANAVMATDIKEPKLQAVRKKRWNSVFRASSNDTEAGEEELEDRKAKLVIEHIMQAGNVAHTMQHWTIFLKWNECLYLEMYQAFKNGRADEDPSVYWHEDELRFFDNHVLPVAKKLKECGVFGDTGDEYLALAEQNRKEWEMKGKVICMDRMEKANENERFIDGS